MVSFFTKTSIGYSHIKAQKPCQDYSASYHDEERTIITACDGHGGDIYVRSAFGSKFASDAAINVLKNVSRTDFYKHTVKEICDSIRLKILCDWNQAVSEHIAKKRISGRETEHLSQDKRIKLIKSPEKAYGTTLNAAMIYGNKLICVSIGDGGILVTKRGAIAEVFADEEEPVANLTHSMCQEDAYDYLRVGIYDFQQLDGVILCTDGVINPYRCLDNFRDSFVKPIIVKLLEGKTEQINSFITELGTTIGSGDDVTFAAAIKSNISLRGYMK